MTLFRLFLTTLSLRMIEPATMDTSPESSVLSPIDTLSKYPHWGTIVFQITDTESENDWYISYWLQVIALGLDVCSDF